MRLQFSREELLASHSYARPYELAGRRMHGGFDAGGDYRSPRTLHRATAIAAWKDSLIAEGHPILKVPDALYSVPNCPSVEQQAYLLRHGVNRVFYNALTTMAEIETKAGRLCKMEAPDFSELVRDDISGKALGHLNAGLLEAHGMDEGGDPGTPEIGGHDRLWLVARDLLFPIDVEGTEPALEVETRMESGVLERAYEDIPIEFELSFRFFMTILLSEARADLFFDYCARLLRMPELFPAPAHDVRLAAEIIARIERDEEAHVGYLTVMFSELRAADWRYGDGAKIIDALLEEMTERQLRLEREAASARGDAVLQRVRSLAGSGRRIDAEEYLALDRRRAA